jgi:glycosyltransferase involved in cell wall biosynthesis
MAFGAPVIAAGNPVCLKVAGQAANWPTCDRQSLAASIEALLYDETRRAGMRSKGLEQAAGFSWERTARETMAVYRRMLEGGAAV